MFDEGDVVAWVADADPSLRWQAVRDVVGGSEQEWGPIRALVETEGFGAQLLSLQDDDGRWSGGTFFPPGFTGRQFEDEGQPWTTTTWALTQLRELGLDPKSASAREAVRLVGENARWDHAGQSYWDGEVEECINGRTVADGAYFGVDVAPIVARLGGESLPDGGWNCERCNGSNRSSFATTINVLEGLLQFEQATGGTVQSLDARKRGEEYLLTRQLFRRAFHGWTRRRAVPHLHLPHALAIRRVAGARLLPCSESIRWHSARCPSRRRDRVGSFQTGRERPVGPRLAAPGGNPLPPR